MKKNTNVKKVVNTKNLLKSAKSFMKDACKESKIKLSVLDESIINQSKNQAECCRACFRSNYTIEQTANKLLELDLCDTYEHSYTRVIRHAKSDKKTRTAKSNIMINSLVSKSDKKAEKQTEVIEQ